MRIPTYRKQKSKPPDRAFVELDGQRFYLGRYDSPESRAELPQARCAVDGRRLRRRSPAE